MNEYKRISSPLEEDAKKVKDLLDLNKESQNYLFEKKLELSKLLKAKENNGPKITQLNKEIQGLQEKKRKIKFFGKSITI